MIKSKWVSKSCSKIKEFIEKYPTSYDGIDTTSWKLLNCIGDNNEVAIFQENNELYVSYHLIWWDVKIQDYCHGCIASHDIIYLIDKIPLRKLLLAKIKSFFNKKDAIARCVSIYKALGL